MPSSQEQRGGHGECPAAASPSAEPTAHLAPGLRLALLGAPCLERAPQPGWEGHLERGPRRRSRPQSAVGEPGRGFWKRGRTKPSGPAGTSQARVEEGGVGHSSEDCPAERAEEGEGASNVGGKVKVVEEVASGEGDRGMREEADWVAGKGPEGLQECQA